MHAKQRLLLLALLCSGAVATVRAGQITYNFDTDPAGVINEVGSNPEVPRWQSKGGNPDTGGFLAITFAQTYFNTGILFPDLDPGKVVTAFTFDCDLRVGNPSTGDRAADGFSISFARAGDPVLTSWDTDPLRGFRGDQASGSCAACENAALPETGTSTGIAVSFDTWSGNTLPDGSDTEGILVVVDNKTVLRQAMATRNGSCADITSLQTGPRDTAYWPDGDATLSNAWKTLCWQPLHVQLDQDGKLTVAWKGNTILDHYQTTYFPTPGQLVFAGRTGGSTEQTHVDNIKLTTTAVQGETQPPSVPGNLKATTIGARRVVIGWDPSVDAPDPQIRVAYHIEKDGTVLPITQTTTTYEDRVNLKPGTAHTYRVRSVDLNQNTSAWASVTVTTVAEVPTFGWYTGQVYDNISGASWNDLITAITDPKFPNSPDRDGAYFNGISYGAPAFGDTFGDNLAVRFAGVLVPTETAQYRFFVRSDDASALWLNKTGASLPNLADSPVAQEEDCCDAFAEPGKDDNGDGTFPTSEPISLTAGQKYGFVYVVKEGGGGDWGQVAWRKEGDATPANQLPPISGAFIEAQPSSDPVGASVAINKDPVDATGIANEPISMNVAATTASPWTTAVVYQWYKDGKAIVNANATNLTLTVPSVADSGKYKVTVSVPGAAATSKEATMTITTDNKPPTITSVHGSDTFDKVTVTFSEPVTDPSATTAANYTISGGVTVSSVARVDPYIVVLTTSKQAEDTAYTLTAGAVKDNGGNSANATFNFHSYVLATGYLKFEVWRGMADGTAVTLLTDWPDYPNKPNFVTSTTAFDSRPVYPDDSHEQYGGRLTGWLTPTDTADYTFFLSSDDASQLWISTDATPAKLVKVAEETGCCAGFLEPDTTVANWHDNGEGIGQTTLTPIHLVAGTKYWVQALWKEGGGGDFVQVAWRKAGDTTAATSLTPIPGKPYLSAYIDPLAGVPVIGQQPTNQYVALGGTATFKVATQYGSQPMTYQWHVGNQAIAGATSDTLTIANVDPTKIQVYDVTVSNADGSTTSSPVVLLPKNANALFIEAEDFNFGGGQYVKDKAIGMTGAYDGGDYLNKGSNADEGIDWQANDNAANPYRSTTKVAADKQNTQSLTLPRGDFDVKINNVVGWNDAGEWYNYTRPFPTTAKDYNVVGRLASGGNPIHVQMDEVTAGATTKTQTLRKLGEFRPGRATAGWDSMEFFPLVDDSGKLAVVSGLAGEKTIRVTMLPSSAEDMDYFMFIPAGEIAKTGFTTVQLSGANLTLAWTSGSLESADVVTGPWTAVNATSPTTVPITGAMKFFRLK